MKCERCGTKMLPSWGRCGLCGDIDDFTMLRIEKHSALHRKHARRWRTLTFAFLTVAGPACGYILLGGPGMALGGYGLVGLAPFFQRAYHHHQRTKLEPYLQMDLPPLTDAEREELSVSGGQSPALLSASSPSASPSAVPSLVDGRPEWRKLKPPSP